MRFPVDLRLRLKEAIRETLHQRTEVGAPQWVGHWPGIWHIEPACLMV